MVEGQGSRRVGGGGALPSFNLPSYFSKIIGDCLDSELPFVFSSC